MNNKKNNRKKNPLKLKRSISKNKKQSKKQLLLGIKKNATSFNNYHTGEVLKQIPGPHAKMFALASREMQRIYEQKQIDNPKFKLDNEQIITGIQIARSFNIQLITNEHPLAHFNLVGGIGIDCIKAGHYGSEGYLIYYKEEWLDRDYVTRPNELSRTFNTRELQMSKNTLLRFINIFENYFNYIFDEFGLPKNIMSNQKITQGESQ